MKKSAWKFIHNTIAHPLLETPRARSLCLWFHDWTAQKAFGHLYYIWWLTQEDLETININNPDLPEVLLSELRSALGRPGRGRLWSKICPDVAVDVWPDTAMAQHCENCAGIVIEAEHMRCIRSLPGVVTDTRLNRVGE